jgi:hypothetical protein
MELKPLPLPGAIKSPSPIAHDNWSFLAQRCEPILSENSMTKEMKGGTDAGFLKAVYALTKIQRLISQLKLLGKYGIIKRQQALLFLKW